ncbi:MAG TPA: DUF3226 domain-containing protein [Gaiellaceae bacterium]|nr:DUF3226 domain-containing protein [Gaiellaceae bacterium]
MKAVFVFCEGNHDVEFTARSLGKVASAQWVGKPIGSLPSPLGPVPDPSRPKDPKIKSVIALRYSARVLDDLSLRAVAHAPPPTFESVIQHGDTLYVLICCHGDAAADAAAELVSEFSALLDPAFGTDIKQLAAAFLFDADENVGKREQTFAAQYATMLSGSPAPTHGTWVKGSLPVGLYVFHDTTARQGTLEDVLGLLVSAEWNARWAAADTYLSAHMAPTDPVAKKPAEKLKAQINITGQFLLPGDPMSQVIGRKGLPAAHFNGPESRALVAFLQGVPW